MRLQLLSAVLAALMVPTNAQVAGRQRVNDAATKHRRASHLNSVTKFW